MSTVTEYFLRKVMRIRMFPFVGKTMKVYSSIFPAIMNFGATCFLTVTILPLAI